MKKLSILFAILFIGFTGHSQKTYLRFEDYLAEKPNQQTAFTIPNSPKHFSFLTKENISIKYQTKNWLFIQATASWMNTQKKNGNIDNFYFEFSKPTALADSAVVRHKVNLVHSGVNLDTSYTGKGVIIGIVDEGLDFNHPDFKLANGKTRVLRYWDHTTNTGTVPSPYNYGIVWNNTQIDNGNCTSLETGTAHGTTVAGMATGNARANGRNKGVAPDADIIVVETDFNLENWTLTIADACDYIFKVADSLGKPAVVNLSLGDYLGSHDGRDPAAEYIDQLLSEKEGRIVVCAAGNSGEQGKYHVTGNVTQDTSFVWSKNNTANTIAGTNKIIFDLWADTTEAHFNFAYGADLPAPTYGFRGRTSFRNMYDNLSQVPVYDTIYNQNGDRIACIETYREIVGANFHAQVLFRTIDSLDYLYRFETVGTGKYDLWAGAWMGLSDFESTIPEVSVVPEIIHYNSPDTLQTIVSSWNCSEKVISVGNIRNRASHIDKNGNLYTPSNYVPVGALELSSSKGPNRLGVTKPDIAASGGISLAAGPMWFISNTANNPSIDQGGFHVRNGGTSMASPVVAGIAALYLQKCSKATFQDFKNDLLNTATTSPVTGPTPNNAYGNGIVNAHETILQKHRPVLVSGPSGICPGSSATLSLTTSMIPTSILWSNNATGTSIVTATPGSYRTVLTDIIGCKTRSNIVNLASFSSPYVDAGPNQLICPNTEITLSGTGTAATYIWQDGVQNSVPFIPHTGMYYLTGVSANGCTKNDSLFIDFYAVEPITYNETVTQISQGSLAFNLTPGIPAGGTYSGDGVIGTSFHPGLAGVGTHTISYSIPDVHGCISTATSTVTVYTSAGIDENLEDGITIYPNPTNHLLNVEAPGMTNAQIISLDGKLIMAAQSNDFFTFDVTGLKSSMYLLEMKFQNGQSIVKRFMVD
jgi:subtilisin family serine protease